jgi:cytochrome P450
MVARATPIPGPSGHPLFGMAGPLRADLLGTLERGFERYGDLVRYRVGPRRGPRALRREIVGVYHPEGIHRVLSEERVFTRETTSFRVLRELFGENIATANGASWRRQRRTLQPLFTRAQAERYAGAIGSEAERMVWDVGQAPGRVIDLAATMERYTLRVLGRTLFGDHGDGLGDDVAGALSRLVPVVGRLVQSRASGPLRLPLAWPTGANRRFVHLRVELYATVDRVLARRARREPADSDGDLVSRLRTTRDPDTGAPLSAEEVRNQALIFLLAGHTTTTSALTSTLYLLARDAETQERVAEAAASIHRDPLVEGAVKEGLRMYPPAHVIGRHVLEDAEIEGRRLAAGTDVLVSPWVTHRHPAFWAEPERFEPRRFLEAGARSQYAYFPFGGGGRTCIGRHFALLELTVLVRELLRAFRLQALDDDLPRAQLITLRPSGPVRVRCRPR